MHPSLKNTLYAAEMPHPVKGLNPQVPPLTEVAMAVIILAVLEQLQGAGAEAGAVLGITTGLAPSCGLSLSSFFMSCPGKAPGMKNNPSACVPACRAQSSVKLFSHPWELRLDVEGPRSWSTAWQRWESPGLGPFPPGDTEQVFMEYRGHCIFFPGELHPWKEVPCLLQNTA